MEYYDLMDNRSAYVDKLQDELRMVFPQYLKIFSKITINTAMTLLEKYTSTDAFLATAKDEIINSIRLTARFGLKHAYDKYNAITQAANDVTTFCHSVYNNLKRIHLYISFIRKYDEEISSLLSDMHDLTDANDATDFVKQIDLIKSFKGAGFLSAINLSGKIGDFSAFNSPKQLFAYFGLDSVVKQSGKFNGTKINMSKRGSRIAMIVVHPLALSSISKNKNGSANNSVLRDYYLLKCKSKPKMVALGVVIHKVCYIVFTILRDGTEFETIISKELQKNYHKAKCGCAA